MIYKEGNIYSVGYSNITNKYYVVMMENKIIPVNNKITAERIVKILNEEDRKED